MKLNIRKISEITGFSPATVSNALNNKKGVNKDTAKRIFEVAKEYGYFSANRIERIRFVIFKVDGIVVSDTPFFSVLIESVENACREAGFETVICNINRNRDDFETRLNEILHDSTAGILLLATELENRDVELFEQALGPVVVLDAWFDNMKFDTVSTNNEDSVKHAAQYLIELGHRKIGYLAGNIRIRNFIYRGNGLKRALCENNLQYHQKYEFLLTPTMEGAYTDMRRLLEAGPEMPTAFVADNDMIALGAMRALKQAGYHIPRDISVIGFDDLPFCEISSPPLSTVKYYQQEMGRLAVECLVRKIQGEFPVSTRTQISTKLVIRDSTAQFVMK